MDDIPSSNGPKAVVLLSGQQPNFVLLHLGFLRGLQTGLLGSSMCNQNK